MKNSINTKTSNCSRTKKNCLLFAVPITMFQNLCCTQHQRALERPYHQSVCPWVIESSLCVCGYRPLSICKYKILTKKMPKFFFFWQISNSFILQDLSYQKYWNGIDLYNQRITTLCFWVDQIWIKIFMNWNVQVSWIVSGFWSNIQWWKIGKHLLLFLYQWDAHVNNFDHCIFTNLFDNKNAHFIQYSYFIPLKNTDSTKTSLCPKNLIWNLVNWNFGQNQKKKIQLFGQKKWF